MQRRRINCRKTPGSTSDTSSAATPLALFVVGDSEEEGGKWRGSGAAAAPATVVDDSVSLARITAGDSAAKSYKEVVKLWRGKSRCAKSTTTPPAAALWIQHRTRLFLSFPDDLMQKKK